MCSCWWNRFESKLEKSTSRCLAEGLLTVHSPIVIVAAARSQWCEWYDNFSLFIYNVAITLLFITTDVGLIGFVFLLIKVGMEEQGWWIFYVCLCFGFSLSFFHLQQCCSIFVCSLPPPILCNNKKFFISFTINLLQVLILCSCTGMLIAECGRCEWALSWQVWLWTLCE